jgi:tRNA (cytidine/uridine-2'-O-)-methyltransferase
MRLALYQPDIPQNTGALLRLAACLGVAVDLIEPAGFLFDDRRLRRVGMDYARAASLVRHPSWQDYRAAASGRLVLLSTQAAVAYTVLAYRSDDCLIVGRESAGAPAEVHDAAAVRVRIPMAAGMRSLNVVTAAAMVLGEALRQTGGFPRETA